MKTYKKILTFTLAAFLLISNIHLPLTYAHDEKNTNESSAMQETKAVDTTPPVLDVNSLKMDKQNVKSGDTINITLKASDDMSGISHIYVNYKSPITSKAKFISLKYNSSTDSYSGSLTIDDQIENGTWKVSYIDLYDNSGNTAYVYSSKCDLSSLNFNVSGNTNIDTTPPVLDINSLKIDKKEVKYGDTINVTLKASDDISGISNIYVNYKSPITSKTKFISLKYNSSTDSYSGSLTIDDQMENGTWKVSYIDLYDNSGNTAYVYSYKCDLSSLNFNVLLENNNNITSITGSTVVKSNTAWSNKIINGDLYIGPSAVLTIMCDVTVTGNIYVLGALKSYGGLVCNGGLYGNNMTLGTNSPLYNGTVIMAGSNSISSFTMTTYPVTDIPLRIDNEPVINNDGKINLKGATLDIADMYIEDTKVELDSEGTFDIQDFAVGNADYITVKFVTVFGNTITKTLAITSPEEEDLNHDGFIDMTDLSMIADNYNKTSKNNNWNSKLDLNKDGIIDIYDIVRVSGKIAN